MRHAMLTMFAYSANIAVSEVHVRHHHAQLLKPHAPSLDRRAARIQAPTTTTADGVVTQ